MLQAVIQKELDGLRYRVYVTDALHAIAENTAVAAAYLTNGQCGKTMSGRWVDGKPPEIEEEEPERTAEEIIDDLCSKLREGGEA